jgi:hypothetical protein
MILMLQVLVLFHSATPWGLSCPFHADQKHRFNDFLKEKQIEKKMNSIIK